MNYKTLITGGVVLAAIIWLVRVAMAPPPGTRFPDLGREHVGQEEAAKTAYNSNPPTSGRHVVTWVKPGVYDAPQQEGELIHSLEHGYVVIHYNCHTGITDVNVATGSATASSSAALSAADCASLIEKLTDVAKNKKLFKIVVVPRPQLDTTIALTAWMYLDKFDTFDKKRIEQFIDYHRDHGPEQTME